MNKINKKKIYYVATISLMLIVSISSAMSSPKSPDGPWFTGPILAPSGRTIPNGHTNVELYYFDFVSHGRYNHQSHFISRPVYRTEQYSGIFAHGLSDEVDIQFAFPYTVNKFQDQSDADIGDMKALLGYQVMKQPDGTWWPNFRITFQETIPTGKFDQLSSSLLTTDDHGKGAYLSTFNANFQTLFQPFIDHYFRTRLSLSLTIPSTVNVLGISHFGGGLSTDGSVNAGISKSIDLAGEFTVNQNWVLVMEGLYTVGHPLRFKGNPGIDQFGVPISFQSGPNNQLSFAPAIEYNFNSNYGIIAGVWFSVKGKNISQFTAPVVAFNAFW
jgi:hypothetical protein